MLKLAMQLLRRDWRSGDAGLLVLALAVAVSSASAIGFLVDRVERAMQCQAAELIGGDLQFRDVEIPDRAGWIGPPSWGRNQSVGSVPSGGQCRHRLSAVKVVKRGGR